MMWGWSRGRIWGISDFVRWVHLGIVNRRYGKEGVQLGKAMEVGVLSFGMFGMRLSYPALWGGELKATYNKRAEAGL
jgi:hypothetical protein